MHAPVRMLYVRDAHSKLLSHTCKHWANELVVETSVPAPLSTNWIPHAMVYSQPQVPPPGVTPPHGAGSGTLMVVAVTASMEVAVTPAVSTVVAVTRSVRVILAITVVVTSTTVVEVTAEVAVAVAVAVTVMVVLGVGAVDVEWVTPKQEQALE